MPKDNIMICRGCRQVECKCELVGEKTNEKDSNLASASLRRSAVRSKIELVIIAEKLAEMA